MSRILKHCQLYIKVPSKLQPEDGFMRAETLQLLCSLN